MALTLNIENKIKSIYKILKKIKHYSSILATSGKLMQHHNKIQIFKTTKISDNNEEN